MSKLTMYPNQHSGNPKEQVHWEPEKLEAPEEAIYGTSENGIPFCIVAKKDLPRGCSYHVLHGDSARPKGKPERTLNFMVRKTQLSNGQEYYR